MNSTSNSRQSGSIAHMATTTRGGWTCIRHTTAIPPSCLLERCATVRAVIPAHERFVCRRRDECVRKVLTTPDIRIEANQVGKGVLWTVPWFKHGWASLQHRYQYRMQPVGRAYFSGPTSTYLLSQTSKYGWFRGARLHNLRKP